MRIRLLFFALLSTVCFAQAQKPAVPPTAADNMKKIPALPEKVCSCDPETRNSFDTAVRELRQSISDDADERERQLYDLMQSKEGEMKSGMIRMSGISEEDARKLQSGKKMTQAEKMEMANKMMQQQTNVSMEEMKKLQKMSKAGQEAWAQGYAAEQQAMAGVKQKNPMAETAMALNGLVAEQQSLAARIQSMQADLQQKFEALKSEAAVEKALMDKELEPFYNIINSNNGEGATQKMVDDDKKARAQVKIRQDKYCEKMTPQMLMFLKESKSAVENALPDYERLDELKYLTVEQSTGVKLERRVNGIESLRGVAFYLGFVEEAFIFRLN